MTDHQSIRGFLARPGTTAELRETVRAFQSSWESDGSVEWFAEWGSTHQKLPGSGVTGVDEIPRGRGLLGLSSWPGGVPKLSLATTLRQPRVVIKRLDSGTSGQQHYQHRAIVPFTQAQQAELAVALVSDFIGLPAKPAYIGILSPTPSLFGVPYNRHNR